MNKSKSNAKSVINSYRKRQQMGPFVIWGLAIVLVVVGILLLILWLSGPSKPLSGLFATETPTPTMTFTPTVTFTSTATSTITLTPTDTATPTPSSPFTYIVQEGDSLDSISKNFNLGDNGIPLILLLNPAITNQGGVIYVGQEITVPNPGMEFPTSTPIPPDLPRGTKVDYVVQAGDTLAGIASEFNSTVDDIVKDNNLDNANSIYVGQPLVIRVNLVTPTITKPPTITPTGAAGNPATATATPLLTSTP